MLGLPRDANEARVENLWQIIKESLLVLQNEFAPLGGRRKGGSAVWWKAAMCMTIKRRNEFDICIVPTRSVGNGLGIPGVQIRLAS